MNRVGKKILNNQAPMVRPYFMQKPSFVEVRKHRKPKHIRCMIPRNPGFLFGPFFPQTIKTHCRAVAERHYNGFQKGFTWACSRSRIWDAPAPWLPSSSAQSSASEAVVVLSLGFRLISELPKPRRQRRHVTTLENLKTCRPENGVQQELR